MRHSGRSGGRRAAAAPATAVTAASSGNHSAQSWRHCTVLAGCGGRSAARRGALRSALSFSAGCTESLILAVRRRRDVLDAPECAVTLPVQWASETAAAVSIPDRSLSVARGRRPGRCRVAAAMTAAAAPSILLLQQCGMIVVEPAVAAQSWLTVCRDGRGAGRCRFLPAPRRGGLTRPQCAVLFLRCRVVPKSCRVVYIRVVLCRVVSCRNRRAAMTVRLGCDKNGGEG